MDSEYFEEKLHKFFESKILSIGVKAVELRNAKKLKAKDTNNSNNGESGGAEEGSGGEAGGA
jgi:hypothetical protein